MRAAFRKRRSYASRSTTGRCSRPPTRRSERSRPSGWPSSRASTRPRCARTSRIWVPTARRGVGYDVEHLLHEISRELGLTHDWPVAIVGVGNLGQALANYRGFGARGFRIVALVDADAEKVGQPVGDLEIESLEDLPTIAARPGRRHRHHRHARPRGAGGRRPPRRRRRHVDPELRTRPWSPRPPACRCARSTSPSSCRSCPSTNSAATPPRRSRATRATARPHRRSDERAPADRRLPGQPRGRRAAVRRRRRRPHRRPQDRRPARRRRCGPRGRARSGRRGRGLGRRRPAHARRARVRARRPRRRLARDHRHRRSPPSTARCSRPARPGGSG